MPSADRSPASDPSRSNRDSGIVNVAITRRSGRAPDQKRSLYRRIAELAQDYADAEPRNVFVP